MKIASPISTGTYLGKDSIHLPPCYVAVLVEGGRGEARMEEACSHVGCAGCNK